MVDLIRWLKSHTAADTAAPTDGRAGFVYVADGGSGPMTSASVGVRIDNNNDRPPWIVVHHKLESTTVAKWPGRLWRVRILRKAPEQPRAHAGYTRATAVHVEEELSLAALFDYNGAEIANFLCSISSFSVEAKAALAAATNEHAIRMHNEIWDRWLAQVDPVSPYRGQDHSGIISMGAKVPRSPVGNAPSVLHSELAKRAREIDGEGAFVTQDEEQSLNPQWSRVAAHLQHALFAIGASEQILSSSERVVLASAYRSAVSARAPRDDA